ncbi:MAG: tetratricopeptide repeat protein [Gammaproteobacteria bacterium]
MAKARQLLGQHKGAEAYQLLQPLVEKQAGNPDFDLLYGMSAIDAGKPTDATFALERVLDAQPDNAAAQAELGRAYYDMGENEAAKQQFERVRGEKLPPTVQQNIDRYLNAIDNRSQAAKTRYRAYVEVGAGYDSNVNSATDQSTVTIGAVPFTLGNASIEQDSAIWSMDTGFSFNSPLANPWSLFGGINLQHRADVNKPPVRRRQARLPVLLPRPTATLTAVFTYRGRSLPSVGDGAAVLRRRRKEPRSRRLER